MFKPLSLALIIVSGNALAAPTMAQCNNNIFPDAGYYGELATLCGISKADMKSVTPESTQKYIEYCVNKATEMNDGAESLRFLVNVNAGAKQADNDYKALGRYNFCRMNTK